MSIMSKQQQLLLLLVTVIVTLMVCEATPPLNSIQNEKSKISDEKIPLGFNPIYNKMLPIPMPTPILKDKFDTITSNTIATPSTEKKPTSKIPLADDYRYNKMFPEKTNKKKDDITENSKKDYSIDANYYDEDEYYDNYDDDMSNETNETVDSVATRTTTTSTTSSTVFTTTTTASTTEKIEVDKKIKNGLKLLKGDDKDEPTSDEMTTNLNDDEDDEDDDDIDDQEEIVYSENVPCPRDCTCARNVNSYLVATCSRLDLEVQKFGPDITDLVVLDIDPKYPIILGPDFFLQIGLKHVSSIKIVNCSVHYIHPIAFNGLDELFAVNLTNVQLTAIHPDTFITNTRLRLLTISGNDLNLIIEKGSPNSKYLFKSSSIEEIDLSNNNFNRLPQSAFSELKNLIYINLSQNNLRTLPEKIFNSVKTIEELDLSFNTITTLPQNIFSKTSLAILHLKYNDITGDLKFGTADLQQLDLSFCSIKHISNFMFSKMQGLTNLNVKGNGLKKVQPEAFLTLKNLRTIDLSMNDLEQVSSLMFYKNLDLEIIRLNDNPRLSQLPTDGFQVSTGTFNVYYFDVSNCAIGALGYNTFSTMKRLTTLKLAWNNINNLDKMTFNALDRLVELDLSNNLIVKLDDMTFAQNRELTKLNLAGNPIKKLSAKLFLPFVNLKELDVSECELYTLLADNYFGVDNRFKFYETLYSFNASFNQIKKISKEDVQYFRNLKTLDISNNPLKCTENFRNLMKWLSKKDVLSEKVPTNANINEGTISLNMQSAQTWDELIRGVCKRTIDGFQPIDGFKPIDDVIDLKSIPEDDKISINKMKANKDDIEEDTSIGDDDDEIDEQEDNDSEYNEDEYDEDSDDDNQDEEVDDIETTLKDKGLFADEVDLIKETEDKYLRGKLGNDGDDDDEANEDEISLSRIYYTSFKFIMPLLIILTITSVFFIIIAKIVSLMARKRGERYRQALLASKNSIVYQKLSEEIVPPQTPKVHRYAPINQV